MDDAKSFLSTVPGFDELDDAALTEVARLSARRAWADGERLLRRGDAGDCMHVVVDGRVRVPIVDEAGRELLVKHLGPREYVGEMALLTGAPRTADALADGGATTLVLPEPAVKALLSSHPTLARFLARMLAQRLGQDGGIHSVGRYRLVGELGAGANGTVYRAVHPTLHRVVAVKMLSHDLVHQPGFRERFLAEARMLANLSHENIVEVFDTEEAFGTVFIVMEAVEGTNLEKLLKQRGRLGGSEIARTLHPVASALQYAHGRGVAHRDVKPANVALEPDGRVKLMDFGLARAIRHDPIARAHTIDGTPQYLAPEIARGREGDGRVDVYALGVMAFELATGHPPFVAGNVAEMLRAHVNTPPPDVRALAPGLPESIATFIDGALVKEPEQRLSDWNRILELLAPAGEKHEARELERIVRLRYPASQGAQVEAALDAMKSRLAHAEVAVAEAELSDEGN